MTPFARGLGGATKHEAMHVLQQAGVPAGAVQNAKDLHHDPQVQALEYFRAAWGSEIGLRIWPGTWYGMQATPGDIRRGTSTFGEDNERVLRDLLGYDPEKVNTLLSSEVFSDVADGLEKPATPGVHAPPARTRHDPQLGRRLPRAPFAGRRAQPAMATRAGLPDVCLDGRAD